MSDFKYTPGPWEAKYTSGAGLSVHANVNKALGPRYSSDCPIYHMGTEYCGLSISYELWTQFPREEWDVMQRANAQLISAAPDLLEALQRIVEWDDAGLALTEDHITQAKDAITKATKRD